MTASGDSEGLRFSPHVYDSTDQIDAQWPRFAPWRSSYEPCIHDRRTNWTIHRVVSNPEIDRFPMPVENRFIR